MKAAIAKSTKKMEETLVVKSLMIEEARNIKSMTKSVETVGGEEPDELGEDCGWEHDNNGGDFGINDEADDNDEKHNGVSWDYEH